MHTKKIGIGKILFKYLFSELLLYCLVSFLFFFVIFFVNNLLVSIQEELVNNVSAALILKFFLYSIPIVIANAAPYAAFVGSLMCLGRFVSEYEFLSLSSLGISDKKIVLPVVAVAIVFSFINFCLNDVLIPYTAPKLNEVFMQMKTQSPAMELQSYSIKRNNDVIIATGLVEKDKVNDILIIDNSEKDKINFLSAKNAVFLSSDNKEILLSLQPLQPRLLTVDSTKSGNFDYAYGEKLTYNFLISEIKDQSVFQIGPGQMSSYDLAKKIKQLHTDKNTSDRYLNWYNLEFQKKFSIPFGTLFFVFLAYALSINLKIYNQGIGFVIGLLISVCYWAVLMFGQQLSVEQDVDSTITAWLPNLILIISASILFWKKLKELKAW